MKLRWVLAAVAGVAGYFAVFGGEYSLLDVRRLEKEREKEMEQLDSTRAEVKRLEARADSLQKDSATLERIAREKYGLIRAGERLYRFAGGSAAAPAAADSAVPPATRPEPAPQAPSRTPAAAPTPLPRGARQARGPARTPTRFAAPAKAGNDFRGVVRPAARRRP